MKLPHWKREPAKQEKEKYPALLLDEKGDIRDEKLAKEVRQKVLQTYVSQRVDTARFEVRMYEQYKRKLSELEAALDREDAEQALAILYSYGDVLYSDSEPVEKDPFLEMMKDGDRKTLQEEGFPAFRSSIMIGAKYYLKYGSIDQLLEEARAELNRIEDIVHSCSLDEAARQINRVDDVYTVMEIEKDILKKDYGIDWKTPAERYPDTHFF